jgi:putative membrane protein
LPVASSTASAAASTLSSAGWLSEFTDARPTERGIEQAAVPQARQVRGDGGLGQAKSAGQVDHARLPGGEAPDDPQARLDRAGYPPSPRRARRPRPALHYDASLDTWHNPSMTKEKDNHKAGISSMRIAHDRGHRRPVVVLIFMIQNAHAVNISFLGAHLRLSPAVALLLAAIAGPLMMAAAGTARITQSRRIMRRDCRQR